MAATPLEELVNLKDIGSIKVTMRMFRPSEFDKLHLDSSTFLESFCEVRIVLISV